MLMPILTVKAAVAAAQVAAAAETATANDRRLPPPPLRISGNQSEAVLKILETLNRHLVGSEPLPKEALIRLLDTLAKILAFPPLPQETLRDFTRRLAGFLETLPPAARLALEKQLGQRNLSVSLRILAEALKGPSIIETPRLLDRIFAATTLPRPVNPQSETRPATTALAQQAQVPGRQLASVAVPDPGLLQAALKKAFGDDGDTRTAIADGGDRAESDLGAASKHDAQTGKSPVPRGGEAVATAVRPQPARNANADAIPQLRAAAAFLAADPQALSLVAAIATGDIDSQIKTELEQQLGLALSGSVDETGHDFAKTGVASDAKMQDAEQTGVDPDDKIDAKASFDHRSTGTRRLEVEGFTGHDLGEWELEPQPDQHVATAAPDEYLAGSGQERPEKALALTLKALVEATLPLPGGSEHATPDALFSALAGETADMGAESLFAELEAADDAAMLAEMGLLTGDIAEQADLPGLEADAWHSLPERPEEKAANRAVLAQPAAESAREAQLPRQPDTAIFRDAIPFAMIPYLPAKTDEPRVAKLEDEDEHEHEEQAAFAGEDEQEERGDENKQPAGQGDDTAQAEVEGKGDAADAYDLYRRMGGLG